MNPQTPSVSSGSCAAWPVLPQHGRRCRGVVWRTLGNFLFPLPSFPGIPYQPTVGISLGLYIVEVHHASNDLMVAPDILVAWVGFFVPARRPRSPILLQNQTKDVRFQTSLTDDGQNVLPPAMSNSFPHLALRLASGSPTEDPQKLEAVQACFLHSRKARPNRILRSLISEEQPKSGPPQDHADVLPDVSGCQSDQTNRAGIMVSWP